MANNHTYAPIVIFAFNRPEHFKKTVSTLAECELAKLSKVIVVVDGPRGEEDFSKQKVMLDYLQSVVAFLSIEVRIRKKNVGLEINISSGITDIMAEYGRAIILEDDILVSTHFLRFMNESLDFYQDKKEVWHISGWNFPLQEDNLPSCFLWRTALGWGWGTWADRWHYYNRDPQS
ncbi:glycosyltransferase family protein, partial [Aeromonas salmonicida]